MKLGLVVEGGGMKCAYSAGVLDVFLDYRINFDYAIGVSAGAANTLSYLAGQRDRNKRFYTDHIKNPLYFGVKPFFETGNAFNLQHIYGTLTNSDGLDPLDYEAIMRNPCDYELVATCAETGRPAYFGKDALIKDDYRHVMASCALPALCRPVEIDGLHYYDGGVSDAIPVRHAIELGCDKLVVITSKTRDFVKEPEKYRAAYTALCARYPKAIRALNCRHIMYAHCQRQMYNLEKQGRAFVFAPSEHLQMSTYDMNPEANLKLYELGEADCRRRLEKLRRFISSK